MLTLSGPINILFLIPQSAAGRRLSCQLMVITETVHEIDLYHFEAVE